MHPPPPLLLLFILCHVITSAAAVGGSWSLLKESIGISAMHMQLMNTDRVVIFDRTDFGSSNISLPENKCRSDPNDIALKNDCTAHSVEYDVASNSVRPLMILTDVWCSSGALMPDGRLIQTGGFNDGDHVVRIYRPCDGCDWAEIGNGMVQRRWYATNHILPDGRQIIIGGRRQYNYEFYPKNPEVSKAYNLPFLVQTNDAKVENNLYPFVFLNTDGNLFIFANNRAILFDYKKGILVKSYPQIPDGNPRCYPSTGSAVLLPLKNLQSGAVEAEVLVCGGSQKGAYTNASQNIFLGALDTCARMKITDPSPQWVIETMPMARVMGDMVTLPNGNILIINGGGSGTAGWEYGRDPVLKPVIYKPDNLIGSRFEVQKPSYRPRMYHSAAILLRDGRVLVGGNNPHTFYNFTGVQFPTDLSLESFSPVYLDQAFVDLRPKIIAPVSQTKVKYGQMFTVRFSTTGLVDLNLIKVTMVSPSFTTHSFSMNQRLLEVGGGNVTTIGKFTYEIPVNMPGTSILAPPGYYMLFVVHLDIPSEGIWVNIQ